MNGYGLMVIVVAIRTAALKNGGQRHEKGSCLNGYATVSIPHLLL